MAGTFDDILSGNYAGGSPDGSWGSYQGTLWQGTIPTDVSASPQPGTSSLDIFLTQTLPNLAGQIIGAATNRPAAPPAAGYPVPGAPGSNVVIFPPRQVSAISTNWMALLIVLIIVAIAVEEA